MGNILIVMPRIEDANRIAGLVQSAGLMLEVQCLSTAADVLRISHDRDFGAVICTKKMRDMNYLELAEYLPGNFSMIVLTSDLSIESFSDKVVKIALPLKRNDLLSTIEMLMNSYHRRRKKREAPPKRNDEDKKLIDKAKQVLMERNGMSEPEAYRYIQKNSMDYGRSMVESAQMIMMLSND